MFSLSLKMTNFILPVFYTNWSAQVYIIIIHSNTLKRPARGQLLTSWFCLEVVIDLLILPGGDYGLLISLEVVIDLLILPGDGYCPLDFNWRWLLTSRFYQEVVINLLILPEDDYWPPDFTWRWFLKSWFYLEMVIDLLILPGDDYLYV